jgi:glycosyltransferase involved in cell wall biosynthesis
VHLTDCALVVVGEGTQAVHLRELAERLGVSDRFTILGFRDNSSRYNRHFDLFAMVSRSEGYCLAMLEAMACELPVVCTRLPIYADLIPEDACGFFDLDDIPSLVLAVKKVLADVPAYQAASTRLYKESFMLSAMASKHVAYYRSLMKCATGSQCTDESTPHSYLQ